MNERSLNGKVAVVTGSSSGIGASVSEELAANGATVILQFFSNEATVKKLKQKIDNEGNKCEIFKVDLTCESETINFAKILVKKYKNIDILVNNAGAQFQYENADVLSEDTLMHTLKLNTICPFILLKYFFPNMRKNNWGRIVSISTTAISYLGFCSTHYTASKSALETITLSYAKEGAKNNVLANVVRCGVIDTGMRNKIDGYSLDKWNDRVKLIPVGYAGKPNDVSAIVSFLVSPANRFLTKQVISVSGGD